MKVAEKDNKDEKNALEECGRFCDNSKERKHFYIEQTRKFTYQVQQRWMTFNDTTACQYANHKDKGAHTNQCIRRNIRIFGI